MSTTALDHENELRETETPEAILHQISDEHPLTKALREGFRHQITHVEDSMEATAAAALEDFRTLLDDRLNLLEQRLLSELRLTATDSAAANSQQSAADAVKVAAPIAECSDPLSELRAAFFTNDAEVPDGDEPLTAATASSAAKAAPASPDSMPRPPELEPLPIEIPDAVDPATLNEAELREVFLRREALLKTVVGYARQKAQQPQLMTIDDLRALAGSLPEELAARVEHTLSRLDHQQRLGELELSLERARVARQMSQLEETREVVESTLRQLGLSINAEGVIELPTTDQKQLGSKHRRWLQVLGFGH